MIIEKENFNILNFVKKDDYTGSYSGMRYLIRSISKEEMKVFIWPEPYAFARTDKELISEKRVSSLIFDSKNNLPKNRFSYDGPSYQISLIFLSLSDCIIVLITL